MYYLLIKSKGQKKKNQIWFFESDNLFHYLDWRTELTENQAQQNQYFKQIPRTPALYRGSIMGVQDVSGHLLGISGNITKVKDYLSSLKERTYLLIPKEGILLRNHDLRLLL